MVRDDNVVLRRVEDVLGFLCRTAEVKTSGMTRLCKILFEESTVIGVVIDDEDSDVGT